MTKLRGFSLPEVLITLGIIGVVAAITLPIMIQNYKKQVTVEKLKEAYNMFQQAIKLSEAQNGEIITWDFPGVNDNDTKYEQFANTYLNPYFRNVNIVKGYYGPWAMSKTKAYLYRRHLSPYYQLSNGMVYAFFAQGGANNFFIFVDINGNNDPNMVGKDVFLFKFHPKRYVLEMEGIHCPKDVILNRLDHCIEGDFVFYFFGSQCKLAENSGYAGGACGALIVKDGWKISNDYPW